MRGPGDGRIAREGSQRRKQAEGAWSGLLGKAAYSVAKGLGYQEQCVCGGDDHRVSARLEGEVGKLCHR